MRASTASGLPRVPGLDGLRGLAIGSVLAWHCLGSLLEPTTVAGRLTKTALTFAWSGVDLFFVLSGYLIGGIVLENRMAGNLFRVFYARRVLRIVPLYAVVLGAFTVASLLVVAGTLAPASRDWLFGAELPRWTYLVFGQNVAMAASGRYGATWLSATWSLAVEEQFYIVLPLLVRVLAPRLLPWALVSVIAGAPLLRTVLQGMPTGHYLCYVLMPSRADALMLGVLCAWVLRRPPMLRWVSRHRALVYGVAACCFVPLARLALGLAPGGDRALFSYGLTLFAVLYACLLVLTVVEERGPIAMVTRWPSLQRLGLTAYGLYLLHQPILGLAHGLVLGAAPRLAVGGEYAVTIAAVIVTIAVAELSWRVLEKPLIALGHRFHYAPADSPSNATARAASPAA